MSVKKTVVFDFDGVIHNYTSGWQGETKIPDPPVPGIDRALLALKNAGYEVVIVSTRCSSAFGRMAIENWIDMYGLTHLVDRVCKEKPPAIVYIDDRAICFDGDPDTLLEKVEKFKPWYEKKETVPEARIDEDIQLERALRLAQEWAEGHVCALRPGEAAAQATAVKMVNKSLSEALKNAEARAEKAERERDAAISDLTYIARTYPVDLCDDLVCQYCKHYQNVNTGCPGWTENDCFEWRGKKEE